MDDLQTAVLAAAIEMTRSPQLVDRQALVNEWEMLLNHNRAVARDVAHAMREAAVMKERM